MPKTAWLHIIIEATFYFYSCGWLRHAAGEAKIREIGPAEHENLDNLGLNTCVSAAVPSQEFRPKIHEFLEFLAQEFGF